MSNTSLPFCRHGMAGSAFPQLKRKKNQLAQHGRGGPRERRLSRLKVGKEEGSVGDSMQNVIGGRTDNVRRMGRRTGGKKGDLGRPSRRSESSFFKNDSRGWQKQDITCNIEANKRGITSCIVTTLPISRRDQEKRVKREMSWLKRKKCICSGLAGIRAEVYQVGFWAASADYRGPLRWGKEKSEEKPILSEIMERHGSR